MIARKLYLWCTGVLSFSLVLTANLSYAAQPKLGTKCPRENAITTVGTNKYLCTKKGKKLVWSLVEKKSVQNLPEPKVDPSTSGQTLPAFEYFPIVSQTQTGAVSFVNGEDRVSQFVRWAKPSKSVTGYVVFYQTTATKNEPCDLTKSLCAGPTRIDPVLYKQYIDDPNAEFTNLNNLIIGLLYDFRVYGYVGNKSEIEKIKFIDGQYFVTNASRVPDAPKVTISGGVGAITINLLEFPSNADVVEVRIAGGAFGDGTRAADVFTSAGIKKIDAAGQKSPGNPYIVAVLTKSKSGIYGSPVQQTVYVTN